MLCQGGLVIANMQIDGMARQAEPIRYLLGGILDVEDALIIEAADDGPVARAGRQGRILVDPGHHLFHQILHRMGG